MFGGVGKGTITSNETLCVYVFVLVCVKVGSIRLYTYAIGTEEWLGVERPVSMDTLYRLRRHTDKMSN